MSERIKNVKRYYPFIFVAVVIHIAYFTLNIGKNDKFKTLISFYGSLSIFISAYSLYMAINNNRLNRISSDIVYINKVFTDINNDIYNFFSKNTKINYYYNELYGNGFTYTNLLESNLHNNELSDNIEENIINKKYDVIIYGSYYRGMPFYDLIRKTYDSNKVILLFGEDITDEIIDHEIFINRGHNIFIREL